MWMFLFNPLKDGLQHDVNPQVAEHNVSFYNIASFL